MKNFLRILLVFAFCLCFVFPVLVAEDEMRVLDFADLLSDEEEEALNEKLNAVRARLEFDVAVITVENWTTAIPKVWCMQTICTTLSDSTVGETMTGFFC